MLISGDEVRFPSSTFTNLLKENLSDFFQYPRHARIGKVFSYWVDDNFYSSTLQYYIVTNTPIVVH